MEKLLLPIGYEMKVFFILRDTQVDIKNSILVEFLIELHPSTG